MKSNRKNRVNSHTVRRMMDPLFAAIDFSNRVTEEEFWQNYRYEANVAQVTTSETHHVPVEASITQADVVDFSLDCDVQFSYTQMFGMMRDAAQMDTSEEGHTSCQEMDLCQLSARTIEKDMAFWEKYTVPQFGLGLFGINANDKPLTTVSSHDNNNDMMADRDPVTPVIPATQTKTTFLRHLGLYAEVPLDTASQDLEREPACRYPLADMSRWR